MERATAGMESFGSRHVPELDGLRGIAILSVIVHHQLTPFSLSGGFLGVDLFFVLSGFLITGLLGAEFEQSKTISLRNFYMRRVLRLGPALLLYLIACLLVTYHTQLLGTFQELKLIAIALAYSTNWRMAFGWDASLDPTAIIWSLSIEEQFYLVWPVLLSGCLALKLKRRFIVGGLVVVILAIAIRRYWLLSSGANFTRLYYGTDTRADALLTGCLLALLPMKDVSIRNKKLLGLVSLLSASCFLYLLRRSNFTDEFLYGGGFSLIALMAGVVILVAADSPPRILSAVLQTRLLRCFGKISYGLYLWHWLVVRSTSFYYLGYWEPWAKLVLAIGISSASFCLIERRFNRLKTQFSPRKTEYESGPPFVVIEPVASGKPPSSVPIPLAN
ncbi:MAG TPA: hypothetical protein DCK93_01730 [Blastocatellia bacterium]|nr:hypothetical protein [Blastocatellia bacterium]